jgi:molybdopterin biosynthesis enzyme
LVGVNAVKPIIEVTGEHRYDELMMPMCLALADKCDAVLRIGGLSSGADDEVARIAAKGGRVFRGVDEIPKV